LQNQKLGFDLTAIAGLWSFDGRDPAPLCAAMLRAQLRYGHHSALAAQEQIAMGRNLFSSLPEDRFDEEPQRIGPFLLVADVRIDNRGEVAAALGLPAASLAAMCDSELLLRALTRWGTDALGALAGEFAFALWDRRDGSLMLSRDFIGMRPLYYHRSRRFFAFSSMPNGIHSLPEVRRELDHDFIAEQLALIPQLGRECHFRDVSRVLPGYVVRITSSGISQSSFWTPSGPTGRSVEDHEEGLREVLDRAVEAQLRGLSDDVATHLSGGLDSSIVTATAARLNAPRKIVAFTAAPRSGFGGPVPRGTRADERQLAAMVAARYPTAEHVVVEAGETPLAGMAEECINAQEPPVNLCNGVWLHAIYKAARDRGLRTLLMGSVGNISISYSGSDLLPYLLARGKLLTLGRVSANLMEKGLSPRSLVAHTLGSYIPAPIWRALARMRQRPTDLPTYSAVNPNALPRLRRRAAERGHDFLFRPRRDPLATRLWMLSRFDGGNNVKSVLARWGVSVRDPTADRRVVEYCLSLPYETYVQGGMYRSLARRAFRDRVPAEILSNIVRGYQAADWYEGLEKDLPTIRELVGALEGTGAAQVLDLDWIRATLRTWPADGWERADIAMRYRAGLLRAVAAAHFMHSVQSESANEGAA
jgi:asparagine synthase (glutamine-hydrolysing)